MKSVPLKTALKHAGAWGIVLMFIALLTIIFSFLGTLFCAALGGMMMGATRASKALALAFSLLCPGVLLGTMSAQRTELAQNQVTVLAGLCLAAFWALYVVSRFLVAFEKTPVTAGSQTGAPQEISLTETVTQAELLRRAAVVPLRLEDLHGRWRSDGDGATGPGLNRVLEVGAGTLALNTLDRQGRICSQAQGQFRLLGLTDAGGSTCCAGVELAAGI